MELSVIIPIYNAEATLRRCLTSVLRSSVEDMEVICVNDGSKDGSLVILKEFAERDARIVVLEQENKGVSEARNAALRCSNGEFIVFVDADDEVTPTYFANLIKEARQHNAELVVCGYTQRRDSGDKVCSPEHVVIQNPKWNEIAKLPMGVCSLLIQSSTLRKKGEIQGFPSGVRYGEDTAFRYSIYPYVTTVVVSAESGYIIYYTPESATSKASKLVGDMTNALIWLSRLYRNSLDEKIALSYLVLYASHTMRRIHALVNHAELKLNMDKLRDAMEQCQIAEIPHGVLSKSHARRLKNVVSGGRGVTFSYYFKRLKSLFRKCRCKFN